MRTLGQILASIAMVCAVSVWPAELSDAKRQGLVGEQEDGYLGLVETDVPQDVRDLVDEVNTKRRKRYDGIANENRIPLKDVEARAGETAIERTRPGNYVKEDGRWRRKPGTPTR